MKRLFLIASAIIALAVPAMGAEAHNARIKATGFGYVGYSFGGACTFCNVAIYNNSTGAQGSTWTNGSGTYSFTMQNTQTYQVKVATCKVHSFYNSGWSAQFPGSSTSLPTLTASPAGGC